MQVVSEFWCNTKGWEPLAVRIPNPETRPCACTCLRTRAHRQILLLSARSPVSLSLWQGRARVCERVGVLRHVCTAKYAPLLRWAFQRALMRTFVPDTAIVSLFSVCSLAGTLRTIAVPRSRCRRRGFPRPLRGASAPTGR